MLRDKWRFGALFFLFLMAGCSDHASAPVDYSDERYSGGGIYGGAQLDSGRHYASYSDNLSVEIRQIEVPARCLLARYQIGDSAVAAPYGSPQLTGATPEENSAIQKAFNGAAALRGEDSSAFFIFEFQIDGILSQECALLPHPFDTTYRLSASQLYPLRKLYLLGWNGLVTVPIDSGLVYQPRNTGIKDSILLRWGKSKIDTVTFTTDSLRRIRSTSAKMRLLRVPAGEVSYTGILRRRAQECRGESRNCSVYTDTLHRTIAGKQDTLYKVVSDGKVELVSEPFPGEQVWGGAYQVLRGEDTLFVQELSSLDSVVLDTLFYVMRGGDTTLASKLSDDLFLLETILRQTAPDTIEQIARTHCLDGNSWCPSASIFEKTLSTEKEISTFHSISWKSALVEKSAPCERVNRTLFAQQSDPSSGESHFPPRSTSRFILEHFTLDSQREECSEDALPFRGWSVPSWQPIQEQDSLSVWWARAGAQESF